jgi:hypothetical protein
MINIVPFGVGACTFIIVGQIPTDRTSGNLGVPAPF